MRKITIINREFTWFLLILLVGHSDGRAIMLNFNFDVNKPWRQSAKSFLLFVWFEHYFRNITFVTLFIFSFSYNGYIYYLDLTPDFYFLSKVKHTVDLNNDSPLYTILTPSTGRPNWPINVLSKLAKFFTLS